MCKNFWNIRFWSSTKRKLPDGGFWVIVVVAEILTPSHFGTQCGNLRHSGAILDNCWLVFGVLGTIWVHIGTTLGSTSVRSFIPEGRSNIWPKWARPSSAKKGNPFDQRWCNCGPGVAFGTLWRPLGRFGRPFRRLWATLGLHSGVLVLQFGVPWSTFSWSFPDIDLG